MPYIGNIVQDFSVNNAMLNTDSVTSIKIDDGTIVNADINDSAAIAMSKLALSITNSEVNASAAIAVSKLANFVTNNAANRVITGSGTTNTLNGNSDLLWNGSRLDIDTGGTEDALRIGNTAGTDTFIRLGSISTSTDTHAVIKYDKDDNYLSLLVSGESHGSGGMLIANGGAVSLSAGTSPLAKLHVKDDVYVKGSSGDGSTGIQIRSGSSAISGQHQVRTGGGLGNMLIINAAGSTGLLQVQTNGTEKFRIDKDGQVGIGVVPDTWSTGAGITVGTSQGTLWGTGDQINLSGNAYFNSGWKAAASKAGASQIEQALGNIDFKVSGSVTADSAITFANAMRINSSGNVGIGTTSPTYKLHLTRTDAAGNYAYLGASSDGGQRGLVFTSSDTGIFLGAIHTINASSGGGVLAFATGSSERMRINASGNVGIGTTSPSTKLDVIGDIRTSTNIYVGESIFHDGDNDTRLRFDTADRLKIETAGVERVAFGGVTTFNETGADCNFRIEGDTDENLFFLDAGNNRVGIGTNNPNGKFVVASETSRTDSVEHLLIMTHTSSGTTTTGYGTGIRFQGERNNGALQTIGDINFEADVNSGTNISAALVFKPSTNGSPTEKMRLTSDGKLGIGTGSPGANIEIYASNNTVTDPLSANNRIRLRDNDSTGTNGQPMGTIEWYSNDSSRQGISAYMTVLHDGSTGNGKFSFGTANSAAPAERVVIKSDGKVGISSSPARMLAVAVPDTQGHIGTVEFANNHPSNAAAVMFCSTVRDSSSTESFLQCNRDQNNDSQGAAAMFLIRTNGDCDSASGSYGSISDERLKENIIDAKSQWDDIKNLRIRNFNFKANPSQKMLGLVAQEVETVCPNLVKEVRDQNITSSNSGDEETTTKSVKTSILYMKAIKALQEAITKIETLEAKVAALEAA